MAAGFTLRSTACARCRETGRKIRPGSRARGRASRAANHPAASRGVDTRGARSRLPALTIRPSTRHPSHRELDSQTADKVLCCGSWHDGDAAPTDPRPFIPCHPLSAAKTRWTSTPGRERPAPRLETSLIRGKLYPVRAGVGRAASRFSAESGRFPVAKSRAGRPRPPPFQMELPRDCVRINLF